MLTKFIQPLAIFLIMYGMGLTLIWGDFRRILMYPISVTIGITLKVIILPLLMFAVLQFYPIKPELAVGFMLLAALPGGAFSNLVSLIAKGNVALSITLTAIASFVTAFTIPIILDLSLDHFMHARTKIPFDFFRAISEILFMTVLPVSLGMLTKRKWPIFSEKAERPFIAISALSLSIVIGIAIYLQWEDLASTFMICGLLAVCVNLSSALIGYLSCRAVGIEFKQNLTVAIELSVINTVLGITIASSTLGNDMIGIPSTVYSIAMAPSIIVLIVLGYLKERKSRTSLQTDDHGL